MDAKECEKISINHEILYYQKFKSEVIDPFIDSTRWVKPQYHMCNVIRLLNLEIYLSMQEILKPMFSNYHYVSRIQKNGNANMYRAKDFNRDQSYFLFSTTQEQLNYLRFPLAQ